MMSHQERREDPGPDSRKIKVRVIMDLRVPLLSKGSDASSLNGFVASPASSLGRWREAAVEAERGENFFFFENQGRRRGGLEPFS